MFKGKLKPTVIGVALFLLFIIAAFSSEEVQAHDRDHFATLSASWGFNNYGAGVTQSVGYEYDQRFSIDYERMGGKGYSPVHSASVSRVVFKNPDRRGLYFSIGATYTDGTLARRNRSDKPIVSDTLSFRLGVGYSWELSTDSYLRLGVLHNSTAGRSDSNKGIDRAGLTFVWRV